MKMFEELKKFSDSSQHKRVSWYKSGLISQVPVANNGRQSWLS